jgi:hypothetical protein
MNNVFDSSESRQRRARLIAFYLPQYHPIPENNEWWGQGFTEWTNVGRAKPLFPGHYQPRVPADLGYYDLRLPEARAAQAALAREAGIEGFCYWHYWFAGRPINELVASGQPDFPFCAAWANDSWQGHWYGSEKRMLIEQTYPGPEDHERHFHAMLPAFKDPRYIRVHGKPLFLIFRPQNLPEPEKFLQHWRELAVRHGLPGIHFVAHLFGHETDYPWEAKGYDGALMTNELKVMRRRFWEVVRERAVGRNGAAKGGVAGAAATAGRLALHRVLQRLCRWPGSVHEYRNAMLFFNPAGKMPDGQYPPVVPNWDNSPRAGRKGVILHGSTPELFGQHLREVLASVDHREPEDRLVFVKSWNEWAEGNYLEPDQKFGRAYLDQVQRAVLS